MATCHSSTRGKLGSPNIGSSFPFQQVSYLGVFEDGPSNGNALLLAPAQLDAFLPHLGVVPAVDCDVLIHEDGSSHVFDR